MLRGADGWRLPVDAPRPPPADILADPHVRLYVERVGAALRRRRRRRSGRFPGRSLLAAVVARADQLGHPAVSLSVMPENPARELYLQAGFRRVAVDGSWAMTLRLPRESVD